MLLKLYIITSFKHTVNYNKCFIYQPNYLCQFFQSQNIPSTYTTWENLYKGIHSCSFENSLFSFQNTIEINMQ